MRQRIIVVTVTAALALASVAPATATTEAPATREPVTTAATDETTRRAGRDCPIPDVHRFPFLRFHLTTAAEVIGIPVAELARALHEGSSIAEVARTNGVEPMDVVQALAAPMHRKIDALVDEGCIRPERGERLKAAVTARVTGFVFQAWGQPGDDECRRPGLYRFPSLRAGISAAATVIGVDVFELVRALHAGSSIAAFAEANGVDPVTVIAALTATAAANLDALVETGCLRRETADAILRAVTARVTAFVYQEGLGPPDRRVAIR